MSAGMKKCRVCGCTDDRACGLGCSWVSVLDDEPPLCSACSGLPGDTLETCKRLVQVNRTVARPRRYFDQIVRALAERVTERLHRSVMR